MIDSTELGIWSDFGGDEFKPTEETCLLQKAVPLFKSELTSLLSGRTEGRKDGTERDGMGQDGRTEGRSRGGRTGHRQGFPRNVGVGETGRLLCRPAWQNFCRNFDFQKLIFFRKCMQDRVSSKESASPIGISTNGTKNGQLVYTRNNIPEPSNTKRQA